MAFTTSPPLLGQCDDAGGAAPARHNHGGGGGQTVFVTDTTPTLPQTAANGYGLTGATVTPDPANRPPKTGDVWVMQDGSGSGVFSISPSGATPGEPGKFTPGGTVKPADLAALQALGDLGQTDAWPEDSYVELGDASHAYWDGAAWAAGDAPVPPNPPTGVQPGQPGSFTPAGADVPADLTELQALGALGQTAAWSPDAFVELGDGSNVTWEGSAWAAWTPPPTPPTGVTGGTPGSFDPPTADIPADLAAANALGLMGSAFAPGEFVLLGDGSQAYFDGADFVVGVAPTPPPPPPDDDIYSPPDPSALTLAAIKMWIETVLGPPETWGVNEVGAVQSILELERAGLNRPEVVEWLDQQPGVV